MILPTFFQGKPTLVNFKDCYLLYANLDGHNDVSIFSWLDEVSHLLHLSGEKGLVV